ncbi:MAG: serine/threonine protein kinase [Labilithrix sp.]|nr:serine/threonine protein kinase [Labilithrix sp.]
MTWIDDRAFRGLKDFVTGAGPGDVLDGRWEIRQRIGEGGMAVVYAGRDRDTEREVAIKIIRAYGDHDDARFGREVEALARASHPAIVEYIAHGMQDGTRYVIMERLVGCSLAERLRVGALPGNDAIVLGERIAGGLAAVHSAGITHRDLKPSNVFLAAESVAGARLVDFGLARPTNAPTLTRKGALVGTPGYMAPEQVRGDDGVGPAADVFALGCVLWECVTGRPLFVAEDDEKLFAEILLAQVPALDVEGVPPALVALVARMLEKEPSRRPRASEIAARFADLASAAPRSESTGTAKLPELAPGIVEGAVVAGRYRVEGRLGAGGMGIVVAAQHLELGTRVALKLLRSVDAADRGRFDREARAASKLESEHVARVLDVGETADGIPYLVMEHLTGTDLADRLAAGGPLPVETAVTYVLETCEGLAEAHALGIVHRDLKPSNLFAVKRRDGSEIIKVLDFGISKLTEPLEDTSRPPTITDAKVVMGSIPYMSPEQLQSSTRVDFRSDVWSLGIVLHELVTGRRPFEGQNATAVAARIAASEPMRLREVRADAPRELEEVILRCLAKDPSRRYPNLAAFARALAPLAPARAQASIDRVRRLLGSSPDEARRNDPTTSAPAASSRRRSRARLVPGVLVAVVIVACAAWMWRSSSSLAPPSVESPASGAVVGAASGAPPVSEETSPPTPPLSPVPRPPLSASRLGTATSAASHRRSTRLAATAPPSDAGPPQAVRPRSSGEIDLRDPMLENR